MTVTHFPHGTFATPNIGGSRLAEMFQEDNIYFVNGDLSGASSSNGGLNPSEAVSIPTEAVDKAVRGGIIYVNPRSTIASAQSYYVDNITIPVTKPLMQIIGCGSETDRPYMAGPLIKATTAGVGSAVLTIYGAGFLTEGVEWTGTGQTADTASIVLISNNGTTTRAYGVTIRNCTLRNAKGHLISGGGAIHIDTAIYVKIHHNLFADNPNSLSIRSTYAGINTLHIDYNTFSGTTTVRDSDIFCTADAGNGFQICGNNFLDGLPNHGVNNKYLVLSSGPRGLVANNRFAYAATTMDALLAVAGTIGNVPTTMAQVGNMVQADTEGESGIVTI